MTAIEIKDLTKIYNSRKKQLFAVDNLNLNIEKGEFFALLGQNGAGKTTTIKMLSCLLPPSSGDAIIMGNSVTSNLNAVKRIVNVSPQETAVAPKLSVKENLQFIAQIYGMDKTSAEKKANDMLKEFGLTDRAKSKAKTLSGGMQRKLSIAMALISNPDVIFLDEPTLGLDVRARRELWKHISELKGKKTIILTTHYLEEAEALADRIGIMHNGKLKALGTAEELKQQTEKQTFEEAFLLLTEDEVDE